MDLEKYSPGFCLLAKLIEEAADDPAMNTVDLGLGAEKYKERFANQTRETLYVTLRTPAQHAREILATARLQIIKYLPRLEACLRAVDSPLTATQRGCGARRRRRTLRRLANRAAASLFWSETEVLLFRVGRPSSS